MWIRFAVAYAEGNGKGHVQSLILGAVLFIAAVVLWALGVIGDLLAAQRVMTQRTFERVRRIELQLGVEPSHYEPGSPRRRRAAAPARAAHRAGHGAETPARRRGLEREAGRGGAAVSEVTVSRDGIVTGNTYDKYGSTNPLVERLMAGFERDARRAVRARRAGARCSTSAAARACSCTAGRSACATARVVGHRPRGGVDPGRLGASARRPTSSTA